MIPSTSLTVWRPTQNRIGATRCDVGEQLLKNRPIPFEEGLDQKFSSLQAQRETCEAFINSQRLSPSFFFRWLIFRHSPDERTDSQTG